MSYQEHRSEVYRLDGYRCVYCNAKRHLQLDHFWPVSLGGKDNIDNLVTSCQSCNLTKSNKMLYKIQMFPMFGRFTFVKQQVKQQLYREVYTKLVWFTVCIVLLVIIVKLIGG